ncbi:unnamed protein product [Mucor circinelloides]
MATMDHYSPSQSAVSASSSNHSRPSSPGPSHQYQQQPQHRLLNRMSTLFGGGKKKTANNGASSSSSAVPVTVEADRDSDTLVASQVDSMFNEDRNASCVDSMYSSIRSRRSNYPPVPNPDTPAPLRTVQLDNPIVHLPTPPPQQQQDESPFKPNTSTSSSSSSSIPHTPSPPPPPPPPTTASNSTPVVEQRKSTPPNASSQKIEDVEAQFRLLLREYAPSADHMSSVNNLTFEQKEMLLRSSRSPALLKKNSTFSHVMPSFSLKATFGIKNKKNRGTVDQQQFFNTVNNSGSFANEVDSMNGGGLFGAGGINTSGGSENNRLINSVRANTAPGRYGRSRSALPRHGSSNGNESYGRSTSRSKLKSTPEYFVHLLQETHVRDLEDSEVLDLRVFLRSVVVSWTSEFLAQGGYEAIANLFKQMKEAPKRLPNDNRILQHLGKCLKTIMTHQSMGTQIVLTNPSALYHIRDILFGPANKKQKQVYGLEISTRSLLLNLLCTLATIQTNRTSEVDYVHGYDVLRRLLLDRPTDTLSNEEDDKKNQPKHVSPFPISLKTDPKEILQMIMENDPNGQAIGREYEWNRDELKPRYTAWMRELQYTVERHIETITFLASVLNYDFNSAYRQIKSRQNGQSEPSGTNAEASGAVMTEEGVVDYIVTHLRLIRTVVTTQPTTYTGNYDEREQEKMRLELMLSGFDKISKILIQCPHPTVRSSYINYLKPLMNPCADLSIPTGNTAHPDDLSPPPLPARSKQPATSYSDPHLHQSSSRRRSFGDDQEFTSDSSDEDDYEISVYADDNLDETLQHHHSLRHHQQLQQQQPSEEDESEYGTVRDTQWRYEQEPYYDDIFHDEEYIEDHFNSDEDEEDEEDESNISGSRVDYTYYNEENDSLYSAQDGRQQFSTAPTKTVNLSATTTTTASH